jgi:hypothetical protein
MGYEYEIQSHNYGPPSPAVNGWYQHPGESYRTLHTRLPTSKYTHPIRDLPNYFQVAYESLGGGRGYEIKSVIAPLKIHKLFITKYVFPNVTFNDHPNGSKNNGGIHVSTHRTRANVTDFNRVANFLHKTLKRGHAIKISQRIPRTFDQFSPQRPYDNCWGEHYNIINHQNHNRYEFRLFAAQKHLLLPALEMSDSLFTLAREVDAITMDNWTTFINSKAKYKHIAEHVEKVLS